MEADAYVLPADVEMIPISSVSSALRERIEGADDDYVVTRVGIRRNSKAVDARFAGLLREFRQPQTIVAAVLEYSRRQSCDPERVLEDAFPLLRRFVAEKLLVVAGSEAGRAIEATLASGQQIDEYVVGACIQVLEDAEVYQCRTAWAESCAMKIERPTVTRAVRNRFRNEASILEFLNGEAGPRLLTKGVWRDRHYLVTEWLDGVPVTQAAAELRHSLPTDRHGSLLALCEQVVRTFAGLHESGVVHGDVHPRNILVGSTGAVSLVDFGVARRIGAEAGGGPPGRAGVAFFFEPEYARARRRRRRPPKATPESDQYAIAALLYLMLTGGHYREFSLDEAEMLRQIEEESPSPLNVPGRGRWPELEDVIGRGLAKDPDRRYPNLHAFAEALSNLQSTVAVPGTSPAGGAATAATEKFSREVFERLGVDSLATFPAPRTGPTASLTYGAAGVAFAFYRISAHEDDPALLSLADLWATTAGSQCGLDQAFYDEPLGVTPTSVGRDSLHHTGNGVHFVRALISHALGDFVSTHAALDLFVQGAQQPSSRLDVTLGRSGVLLGCAQLLDAIPEHELLDLEPLWALGKAIAGEIWRRIDIDEPCSDSAGIPLLGIAHGWAGLLYAAFEWMRVARTSPPRRCEERLGQLAELAEPAGRGARWSIRGRPTSGRGRDQHMPGWCNGAAGYVFLWTAAHSYFGDERWGRLAERAAWNAFEDPDRANNLCCGLAGRSYALLNVYKWTGASAWLDRARQLAARAVSMLPDGGTGSNSLYKGDVGLALLARELEHPEDAAMPAFEPEGWPAPRSRLLASGAC